MNTQRPDSAPIFSLLELTGSKKISWANFDAIALPIHPADSQPALLKNPLLASALGELSQSADSIFELFPEATGKAGEIFDLQIDHTSIKHLYLVGVGEESLDDMRKAGVALARKTKGAGVRVLTAVNGKSSTAVVHINALILANFLWSLKSKKESKKPSFTAFSLVGSFKKELLRAEVIGYSTWRARELIHTPANIKDPAWMAAQAKKLVASAGVTGLSIKVLSRRELKRFGGLLAVGNSAPKPGPRMVEISYAPAGSKNWPHVVMVGKGITFDTGGISLKRPYDFMVPMKTDMTGSAVVLGAITGAAQLAPKVRITALMMLAENAVSSTSQRPSDVIVQYDGTSVEVTNTDAEGRLVLADGLGYANLELDPDYLIDIATLTGSATLGLGRQYGAMYSRDAKLAQSFATAGENICERVWRMPLVDEYADAIKSDIADFNHITDTEHFSGGSITAALFLEKFVGNRSWVHFDIAGPARSESDSGENPKGGTAFGVRLLIEWLTSL